MNAIKNSGYPELASDLEINKAVMFLRQKNFKDAVETLKMFEKKETKIASTAATNLSFLYILVSHLCTNVKLSGQFLPYSKFLKFWRQIA